MKKLLYIDCVVSYFCKLNCTYCELTKEQRQEKDFLELNTLKLSLLQTMVFFKRNNYNELVISITGDELHELENPIEYLTNVKEMLKTVLKDIPREQVKIKMHSNGNGEKEFYDKQFKILSEIDEFAKMEYEIVYHAMYHNKEKEEMLEYIRKNVPVEFVASLGIRHEDELEKAQHIEFDQVNNFGNDMTYQKFTDKNINFIVLHKQGTFANGCGFDTPSTIMMMQDHNFCEECTHEYCEMLNKINRI